MKLPTNFYVSSAPETTPNKPICFFADDSIRDFLFLVNGAIEKSYGYKGYCCEPEKFPWKEIYTQYFQAPENSKLFFDFDGTISKLEGGTTVYTEAYRDFFINGHEKIRDESVKIVLDNKGVQVNLGYNHFILKGGTEDEIMDNFIENLKRKQCALFRIDPKFIETMCVCENPPEKIHIVTRNGGKYVRRMLMAEIELSLISNSTNPVEARQQARNFVDTHFDINEILDTKAENVKKILNRTAVNKTAVGLGSLAVAGDLTYGSLILLGTVTTFATGGLVLAAFLILAGLAAIVYQFCNQNNASGQEK